MAKSIDRFEDIVDRVAPDQRVAYVGPTGCGKSRAMAQMGKYFDNVVMVAPKGKWDWYLEPVADPEEQKRSLKRYGNRAYDVADLQRELRNVAIADTGDPIVFLPPRIEDERLHRKILDTPFRLCLERGNSFAGTDELFYHASGTNFRTAAPWLFYYITGGRSEGCGGMYAFQRPVWVPKVALSETEHFLVWYLQEEEDRDAIDARAGKQKNQPSPIDWETLKNHDHTFVYFTRRFVSEPFIIDFEKEAA